VERTGEPIVRHWRGGGSQYSAEV